MAEGDMVIYNDFKEQVLSAKHNLVSGGHAINITLHTGYTPDIDAHQVRADVVGTEYGTAAGYTAGGKVLGSQTVTQDNANDRALFDGANVTWTALGPLTPNTPSHAIIWNDGQATPTDPLIAYVVLGTTPTNGGDYTLAWSSAPSAIISLT
jgi:hypothetical protein